MNIKDYNKIVKKYYKEENKLKNALLAFVSGGTIGLLSTIIYQILLLNNVKESNATSIVLLIIILLSTLLTGLGLFDNLVEKFRAGLIIPITGFAHSVASSTIEYKKDGLITGIGSNIFKLAGSVLLYGMFSAFILTIIKVIINV